MSPYPLAIRNKRIGRNLCIHFPRQQPLVGKQRRKTAIQRDPTVAQSNGNRLAAVTKADSTSLIFPLVPSAAPLTMHSISHVFCRSLTKTCARAQAGRSAVGRSSADAAASLASWATVTSPVQVGQTQLLHLPAPRQMVVT